MAKSLSVGGESALGTRKPRFPRARAGPHGERVPFKRPFELCEMEGNVVKVSVIGPRKRSPTYVGTIDGGSIPWERVIDEVLDEAHV